MERIDSHCHFWRLERGDYGWLDGSDPSLDPIRRDFMPGDHPGGAAMVAVQAAPSEAETEFLLQLAEQSERIVGVVGWVDLASAASLERLEAWSERRHFVGIRPMLQDIAQTGWLVEATKPELFARLGESGLTFDALVTERHLAMLAAFAERHRDLPVVVDHAAKPQPERGEGWSDGMKALARQSQVCCKLSGLLTELGPSERDDPLPALQKIVRPLLDWFGPQRLLWGSDWPVLTLAGTWARWCELTDELLADLTGDEREAILGGNARRFYGLPS